MPTLKLVRMPASVIVPAGAERSSAAVTFTSSRWRETWLGPGMCLSKALSATGTRPGCATQVPSCPSVASRSLSARTFASASSLAWGLFFMGICAAMPPMACALRRWQTLITYRQ